MPAASIAIAFWVFVAVVSVAGIIADYRKRQAAIEPLRLAIERGQQLDPAVVERLMAREQQSGEINPVHLEIGGIITLSAGVGICILAWFISRVAAWALYPIMGGGVVALCVGAGLIIASKALVRSRQARGPAV